MKTVSVHEFSYDLSGMFARVERGETIQVTRQGKVIAVLVPGSGPVGRYADLVAAATAPSAVAAASAPAASA